MLASLGFWFSVFLTTAVARILRHNLWSHPERNVFRLRGGANGGRDDGPYSFSLTTFSPRGSLSQIEYAMNSALVSELVIMEHEGLRVVSPRTSDTMIMTCSLL